MKKPLLLLALPFIALTSCEKDSVTQYKLQMEQSGYVEVAIKSLTIRFTGNRYTDSAYMNVEISNRSTKDVTMKFKNTYFTDSEGNKYTFDLTQDGSTVSNVVEIKMYTSGQVRGTVTFEQETYGSLRFHTIINGKWEFTIKNVGAYQ